MLCHSGVRPVAGVFARPTGQFNAWRHLQPWTGLRRQSACETSFRLTGAVVRRSKPWRRETSPACSRNSKRCPA